MVDGNNENDTNFKYNLIVTLYPWIPRIYYYFFLSWATG